MNLEQERNTLSNQPTGFPIDLAMKVINRIPYGDPLRLALRILFETGARPCEINAMYISDLRGQIISWHPLKNQRCRPRCEILSLGTIDELKYVRDKFKCSSKLLPYSDATVRRMFNKAKLMIGLEQKKKVAGVSIMDTYQYTLKGFRKTFATKKFKEYWDKYNDPHLAVIMVARDMRHSTKEITANHYILENFEELGIIKYKDMKMWEIMNLHQQNTLESFNKKTFEMIKNENNQSSLSSW